MAMRVLGIHGSPRKGGNTDLMLDAFLEGAREAGAETERLAVRKIRMNGCIACGACDKTGECSQKDGMTEVYPVLDRADGIVVSAPVFFYGVPGQLKLLIDRSQAPYMRKHLREKAERSGETVTPPPHRPGFFLSAGATRGKRLFDCSSLCIRYFFDALDVTPAGELCFRELDEKGAVLTHGTALDECRRAGRLFVSGESA
jgi:hypothetical protein